VQRSNVCLLLMFIVLSVCLMGCGGDDGGSVITTPIQMEMSTESLHPRVGLSGFVFGTFVLLNAYLMIILSCAILIVKENTINKMTDTIRMVFQMLNPSKTQGGTILNILGLISNNDTRVQIGSVGLIAGILLAYLGAWIAM
jgi:hypothetical protein